MEMICPFCKKKVENENAAIHGCQDCIEHWIKNQNIDHPVD